MSNVQKSFTTMGLTAILSDVTSAVIEAEKKAKSSRDIQTLDILRPGLRQDLYIGKLMVIPYNVMDDMTKVPLPILKGATLSLFDGEDASYLEAHRLAETEFDELEPKDFVAYKDKVFRDEKGKLGCLCVFLPAWGNPRDYSGFRYVKDSAKLEQLIRHLVFSAYFRPSLSSLFDILEENQLKLDAINIEHDHMGGFADLMAETNTYPVLEGGASKTAAVKRKPMLRFAASEINAIREEILSAEEKAMMDQLTESILHKAASAMSYTKLVLNDKMVEVSVVKKDGGFEICEVNNFREPKGDCKFVSEEEFHTMKNKKASVDTEASMVRFGEEDDEADAIEDEVRDSEIDGTMVSGPNADEDLIIAIATDAEDLVSDEYLSSGDGLDLIENVDSGAYDEALEKAVYDVMEKRSIPYHDAEEVAAKVMEYLDHQYNPESEKGGDYDDVIFEGEQSSPDPETQKEIDDYYGNDLDLDEPKTSSKKKRAFMDFFSKCESCGALTGVPPGTAPEGHAVVCEKCKEKSKTSTKKATPTSWSIDNTRDKPEAPDHETTEDQVEEKKTPKIHTSVSGSFRLKAEKAAEYFDVVRSEPEESTDNVTDGAPLQPVANNDQVKKDLLSTVVKGEGLKSREDYGSEDSKEAVTPETVDGPDPMKAAKKGGLKNFRKGANSGDAGSVRQPETKEAAAFTYQHPGEALHLLDEDQEGVLLRPDAVQAPDLKVNPKKSSLQKFAFDWMAPGQVLKEFYPGIHNQMQTQMHDKDDYHPIKPDEQERESQNNSDITLKDNEAEEKHTLTSPGLVSTESGGGTPLRSRERNIRGPFFMDQFYKIHADISPANLTVKSSLNKTATLPKTEIIQDFLSKLSAEIASTLLAAFQVSDKPAFVGVATEGTIDLKTYSWQEISPKLTSVTDPVAAQIKNLLESISDSELTDVINESWSQAAVWKDSGSKPFLYEVFVRIESVDTDTMLVTYKFITSLKSK